MRFLVIQLMPIKSWQHQCIDKYTYNTSSYKKTKDLSRTQADIIFNSEGSPLLHPVAPSIIKSPCENNIKSRNFIKKVTLL